MKPVITAVLTLAGFHIFCGLVSMCIGVVSSIKAEVWLAHCVSPIWSGGFFAITGILGVFCARRKSAYMIMSFTAFSVVSLVTVVVSIQLLRLGLVNHTTDGHTFQKKDRDMLIIMSLALAGTECLTCIISTLFSCRMAKEAKEELCKQREGMFYVKDDENRCTEIDFSQLNDAMPEMVISTLNNAEAQVATYVSDIEAMTETCIEQNAIFINDEQNSTEICINNKNEECHTKMYSENNATDDVMYPRGQIVNSIVMTSRELNMTNSLMTPRGQIINGMLLTPRGQIINEDSIQLEMAMTPRNLKNNSSESDEAEYDQNASADPQEEKTENRNSVKHMSRTSGNDDTSVPNIQI